MKLVSPFTSLTLLLITFSLVESMGQVQEKGLYDGPSVDLKHGAISVTNDGRYFKHEDGTPFFWLGDTAWELFHRLTRGETDRYLEDRRGKGFTVIQAVILADLEGLTVPNANGHTPLLTNNPATPDENYFKDVDYVVNRAESLGMYIGLLPTWGDKFNKKWGFGPEIFTPENAKQFGEFLGKRYADKPVIWILGGDRIPETDNHFAIVRAMAEGIRMGDHGKHLMTFHPWGETSSSQFFHRDKWLDFNMFQSGHVALDMPNYVYTKKDYDLKPAKPVVDGEPRYEDHPVKWDPKNGWFNDFDVRQAAYWSMLSGAAGHTYGDNNLWQMWRDDRKALGFARTPWDKALQHPGAIQMGYMRKLFESRQFEQLVPAQQLLVNNSKVDGGYEVASIAKDGTYLIAYSPFGREIELILTSLKGTSYRAYWFDPRTGATTSGPSTAMQKKAGFTPPGKEGRGNDWVLVIETDKITFTMPPGQ